jgi:DNA polymerase gamma 1
MQGDSTLTKEKGKERASKLYKATKGERSFQPSNTRPGAVSSLWHGGSESYLFNTLEAIALSERPTTPALGCGVTRALRKTYLEEASSYLPSRINWVVQSSGVDYLHLLIVSMEYLIKRYGIKTRYLLSVHDEVRYLAREEDRYRTALALQIANAWTRALFSFNLGIDDLPQGVTFFSAVDIDHVLRKEVFMTCETPSHPRPIPQGESLEIDALLQKTNGGQLGPVVYTSPSEVSNPDVPKDAPVALFSDISSDRHRAFLDSQSKAGGTLVKRWLASQPPLDPSGDWTPPPPKRKSSKKRVAKKVEPSHQWMDEGHHYEAISLDDWDSIHDDLGRKAATG